MPSGGERAYAYAKACGIIGKSFVGKRIAALGDANRLADLDRLVFHAETRELPERELLPDLEDRFLGRAVKSIISIIECFSHPPEALTLLLRSYEYQDLKSALSSALGGEKKQPPFTDLGPFGAVNFSAWPDIPGMIEGTEFAFLLDRKGALYQDLGGLSLQTVLDRRYYHALWKALMSLPAGDRLVSEKLLGEEISLLNSGWALRLRTYYWMTPEEVKLHLVYIPEVEAQKEPREGKHKKIVLRHGRGPSLAAEALASLELPLDNRERWASWRWAGFLNPENPGETWRADPRYFQNAAAEYLYQSARHSFHLRPFSLDTIFCFIKLKQFEEDLLTSDAEGLGLGFSGKDVFKLLEVAS